MMKLESNFTIDKAQNKIIVSREFKAPLAMVWDAWTIPSIMDQWWAPKPWKAQTKKMDFREGGSWLYCMVGPNGETHWSKANFKKIETQKLYAGTDSFCDEEGNPIPDFPESNWHNEFSKSEIGTLVNITITFSDLKNLEQTIEMGFKEGFAMAHGNLDELLISQS